MADKKSTKKPRRTPEEVREAQRDQAIAHNIDRLVHSGLSRGDAAERVARNMVSSGKFDLLEARTRVKKIADGDLSIKDKPVPLAPLAAKGRIHFGTQNQGAPSVAFGSQNPPSTGTPTANPTGLPPRTGVSGLGVSSNPQDDFGDVLDAPDALDEIGTILTRPPQVDQARANAVAASAVAARMQPIQGNEVLRDNTGRPLRTAFGPQNMSASQARGVVQKRRDVREAQLAPRMTPIPSTNVGRFVSDTADSLGTGFGKPLAKAGNAMGSYFDWVSEGLDQLGR